MKSTYGRIQSTTRKVLHNTMFVEKIKPFIVMDVLERAIELEREGRSIIHLEIGEPDFPTPEKIVSSAIHAREAISSYYSRT